MKSRMFLFLIAASSLFVFSCSSDDAGVNPNTFVPKFTADIDGSKMNADTTTIFIFSTVGNKMTILAIDRSTSRQIDITMDKNIAVGQYSITLVGAVNANYHSTSSNTWASTTGSLNITKHDLVEKIIEGTFSFTASNNATGGEYKITNGIFSQKYN